MHCNLYVIDQMSKKNIYLPDTNANGIDSYLKSSKQWQQIARKSNGRLDHETSYKAAKKGKTVLVTYNTGNNSNGHIAVVYGKKKMAHSKNYNAYVPYVNGAVKGKKAGISLLSYQFARDKESKMNYFLYRE